MKKKYIYRTFLYIEIIDYLSIYRNIDFPDLKKIFLHRNLKFLYIKIINNVYILRRITIYYLYMKNHFYQCGRNIRTPDIDPP